LWRSTDEDCYSGAVAEAAQIVGLIGDGAASDDEAADPQELG
jgi:hypothetical protein